MRSSAGQVDRVGAAAVRRGVEDSGVLIERDPINGNLRQPGSGPLPVCCAGRQAQHPEVGRGVEIPSGRVRRDARHRLVADVVRAVDERRRVMLAVVPRLEDVLRRAGRVGAIAGVGDPGVVRICGIDRDARAASASSVRQTPPPAAATHSRHAAPSAPRACRSSGRSRARSPARIPAWSDRPG
jgi:hypothetical protein